MTAILGIIQFLLIAYILLYEFKKKSSATFLWAALFIMFGIMHMLASFTGDETYSNTVLARASLFAIAFCLLYLFTRVLVGSRVMEKNRVQMQYDNIENSINETKSDNKLLFIILVVVELLAIYPYLKYSGNIFLTSWSISRDYSATLGYVNMHQIYRIIYYSLSGLMVTAYIKKQRWLFVILGVLLLAIVILTRNRIEILPLFCSIITIFIMKNKSVSLKVVIIGTISAVAVIYIIYGLRVFRHYGTISDFISNFEFFDFTGRINRYIQTDNGELGLRRDFYYFLQHNNNFEDFGKGHTYIRMLLVYIPSQWSLGLKPDDFAIAMGRATGMAIGGSTHPTLFGDCYANLDIFGVFLGIFWALYATFADWITIRRKDSLSMILVYVLNSVVYVIIGRGSVYNAFWFVAYGVPLILFIEYLKYHMKVRIKFKTKRMGV